MNLSTYNTTIHEIVNENSSFPTTLREHICKSVEQITTEEMGQLLSKHEANPENFDSQIETNLRNLDPTLDIKTDNRISNLTRFDNDLMIQKDNILVCLEIEKGYLSRFEFDILKMQAFASRWKQEKPDTKIYGVFIVPADNVVASHISGNARESSYKYLCRLSRLIAQIDPLFMDDILLVGYSSSILPEEDSSIKLRVTKLPKTSTADYLVKSDTRLIDEDTIKQKIQGYPLELIFQLRQRLIDELPGLREKLNYNSRYMGYANDDASDSLYVYMQRKQLVLDVRVSKEEAEDLRRQGFKVNPRNNYQCRAGWLTGLSVPYDTQKVEVIVDLCLLALRG